MVAFYMLSLACLFSLLNPAAGIIQQVNRPDINWDYSTYHETRLGHTSWFHYYRNSVTAGVGGFSGASCGQCFELKCIDQPRHNHEVFCNPGSIVVRIADCEIPKPGGWPSNHFDLSPEGFGRLANNAAGIVNIKFRRIHCPSNHAKWTLASDSNVFFHDVVVYDVPVTGSVAALWAKPAGQRWTKPRHAWGAYYWAFGNYYVGGNTEVKIILAENMGKVRAHFVVKLDARESS